VICEKDRVVPAPRFTRRFTGHLPPDTLVTTLDGVGHIPMFEAPDRISQLIVDFVDHYAGPKRTG
jgi:pimeloyl-ACP methyl ester carboxylesterase